MDRWTKRTADGVLLSEDREEVYTPIELIDILLERLAAYEDTGLTPQEIRKVQEDLAPIPFGRFLEIMEAERAGRLLVLPCRVGDTVYRVYVDCDFPGDCGAKRTCKGCEYRNAFVEEHAFCMSMLHQKGTFGHPYYLTREEAEAALKGGGDHA